MEHAPNVKIILKQFGNIMVALMKLLEKKGVNVEPGDRVSQTHIKETLQACADILKHNVEINTPEEGLLKVKPRGPASTTKTIVAEVLWEDDDWNILDEIFGEVSILFIFI